MALLGPSGSGKSTLLTIVAGIVRPSAGRVEVFGTDLARASRRDLHDLRRSTLGLMLQGASTDLLLHEMVTGNVHWALQKNPGGSAAVGREVLDAGGLVDDQRPVGSMSPSEQQIAALAVAMAGLPRLLLADEPTSQLDDGARDRILDVMVDVAATHRTAVLLVTRDGAVAGRMQRMIHLRDGRVGEEETETGRYAVVGVDGSIQLPESLRGAWPPGSLVSNESPKSCEIHITPAGLRNANQLDRPGVPS